MLLQLLTILHIGAAIIFVGNIITAAFWKIRADRSGNLEAMALTSRLVLQADYAFTIPGIVALLGTGIGMVGITSWARFHETWLAISFVLLIITALIWFFRLLPLQFRMRRLSQEGAANGVLDPDYAKASKQWVIFGGIATSLPIVILILMVLKPSI